MKTTKHLPDGQRILLTFCLIFFAVATNAYPIYWQKKGVGRANGGSQADLELARDQIEALNVSWYYNWNIARNALVNPAIDYVPMRHNRWWPNLDNLNTIGDFDVLLTFNEPERADQGDITVSQALAQWPGLEDKAEQFGVQLSSPAPANPTHEWLTDFMSQAESLDLQVDFMAMHKYPTPQSSGSILNGAQYLHDTFGGRDVWITEFNAADWGLSGNYTHAQSYTWMAEVLYRLESTEYIKRYAIFPWDAAPRNGSPRFPAGYASYVFEMDGDARTATPTPLGKLYANYRSEDIYGPYVGSWYYLHNRAQHERLANSNGLPSSADVYTEGDAVEFRLQAAENGNVFIINHATGLRLGASADGSTLYWSAASSDADTQWSLQNAIHNWHYIQHATSGKRLSMDNSNTISLENGDGKERHWAFIRSNATDPLADDDGDGADNHSEFVAGTDASDARSFFRIKEIYESPQGVVLNWDSVTGRTYTIEWTNSLDAGFIPIQDTVTHPTNTYTDSAQRTGSGQYYRIRVVSGSN